MRLPRWSAGVPVLAASFAAAAALSAQSAGGAATPSEQLQARHQIFVMEGVLERAVELGARKLSQQVQAVMPDMMLLAGAARARGFRLEGYGVFFDVEVPALRRSVAWSFRTLDQNDLGLTRAIQALRQHVASLADAGAKQSLEQALRRLELQVGPPPGVQQAGMATNVSAAALEPSPPQPAPVQDPGEAYTAEVKEALIDAMLDYSGPISIGADEWLTIAARDNEDRSGLAPTDPYDVTTIILRVRGADLAAFRGGRTTRDEARRRVEVKEF